MFYELQRPKFDDDYNRNAIYYPLLADITFISNIFIASNHHLSICYRSSNVCLIIRIRYLCSWSKYSIFLFFQQIYSLLFTVSFTTIMCKIEDGSKCRIFMISWMIPFFLFENELFWRRDRWKIKHESENSWSAILHHIIWNCHNDFGL